jgi:glycosyltransferase involved in cell wall biosynthesis
MESPQVRSLLLVRNSVEHDARVLRAARVAEQALGGTALVVGVESAGSPAGASSVEGVPVLRLPARTPGLRLLARGLERVKGTPARMALTSGARPSDPVAAAGPPPSLTLSGRLRRIIRGLSFLRQAILVARRTRPKLVQANDWNTMWTGLAIKLGCGSQLVYDSHELWADRNGRWEWRPWLLASEALFVRAADEVVTSSSGYADTLARRYRTRRPAVIRNIPQPAASESRPSPPRSDPPRVVYIGGLMPGRGLEQMIDALPHLPRVHLCMVGPGAPNYRSSLLARAQAAEVGERIELRAPVAPGEVRGVLAGAAAGLCLIQPICRSYELCLPNKLFEYAAAGIPVLASDVPGIAAVVRDEGLGEVVSCSDPLAIATGLQRLLAPAIWRRAAEHACLFAETNSWHDEAASLSGVYRRAGSAIAP